MIVSSCLARSSSDAWACGTMIDTVCEASGAGASSASIRLTSERQPAGPEGDQEQHDDLDPDGAVGVRAGLGLSGPGRSARLGPVGSIGTVGGTGVLVMTCELRQAVRTSAAKRM